jgi:hypothetical protein
VSDSPADRREAAATRRRWVSLAEVLAVVGVVIAALTLWINWSDRRADVAAKTAVATSDARDRSRVDLVGTVERGGKSLALKDPRHDVQDAAIVFPKALGVATQHPVGDPAIDADWFADALLTLTDGKADARTGRLPVLVSVTYWDGDVSRSSSAIYDIVWRTEGRFLRGRALRIEGWKLRQRGGSQAALDAAWVRAKP